MSIKLPKNDFTRKMNDFDTFTKLPNNEGNLGKIIVATGFEWLPKVQKIAQSGHTDPTRPLPNGECISGPISIFNLMYPES